MKIIIVGGNQTTLALSNVLGEEHEITLIENDETVAKMFAEETHALVVKGDGSNIAVLNEAGLQQADAIIACTDDKTNLMICTIAQHQKIEKIIALVNEPQNEELFTELGVHNLVSVVDTNVTAIKRMLYKLGDERIVAQIGNGKIQIIELLVTEKSQLIGKGPKINEAVVSAIYRQGDFLFPDEKTTIEANDILLIVTKTEEIPKLNKLV